MSANIERTTDMIFVAGNTPWHGLGVNFPEGITLDELIQHECLNWQVALRQLYMDDATPVDRFAVVRSDTGAVLGTVGRTYVPIQNDTNLEWFRPYLDSGEVEIETAGTIGGGRRVWVLAKIKDATVDVASKDDPYVPYFLASNGHDGTMAQRLGFTATRVVCQNTMTAAHGTGTFLKLRHTKGASKVMGDVHELIDMQKRTWKLTVEQWRELSKHAVRPRDITTLIQASFEVDKKKRAALLEMAIVGVAPKQTREEVEQADGTDFAALLSRPSRVAAEAPRVEVAADDEMTDVGRLARAIMPLIESGRGNDRPGYAGTALGVYAGISEYITHNRGRDDNRLESQWFGGGANILNAAQDVLTQYVQRVV